MSSEVYVSGRSLQHLPMRSASCTLSLCSLLELVIIKLFIIVSAGKDELRRRIHYHSLPQAAKGRLEMFSEGEETESNGLNFRRI